MYYFILSSPSIKMILEEVLHLSCLAQKDFKMALITKKYCAAKSTHNKNEPSPVLKPAQS